MPKSYYIHNQPWRLIWTKQQQETGFGLVKTGLSLFGASGNMLIFNVHLQKRQLVLTQLHFLWVMEYLRDTYLHTFIVECAKSSNFAKIFPF